jgi:hypothetical protein
VVSPALALTGEPHEATLGALEDRVERRPAAWWRRGRRLAAAGDSRYFSW